MKAEYRIKREILRKLLGAECPPLDTEAQVDNEWYTGDDDDAIDEAVQEFRGGFIGETQIPCEWSRHYESKSVAALLSDGSWVGWTYWYGGGKHGEPSAIAWLEHAYNLECTEEQKMMTVRTWKKVE